MSIEALEFPTVTMRLRVLPGKESLTWEEGRRLAHCRVVWKACKREEEKRLEREREERRAQRINTALWILVVIVSFGSYGGLVYLATTDVRGYWLIGAAFVVLGLSVYVSNKLARR